MQGSVGLEDSTHPTIYSRRYEGKPMNLALKPIVQKRIDERVTSGKYSSPEEVVAAAIMALDQQEQFGDFKEGELNKLLAEGERSIKKEGTLDGEETHRRRQKRKSQRQD
jgi:Arc/MetJ-type ribon-helix-helix transcriptional regulator